MWRPSACWPWTPTAIVVMRPRQRLPTICARSSNSAPCERDAAVRALVDEAFVRASAVLSERRTLLEQGAEQLLAQETLTEADLQPLFDAARQRPAPP